MPEPVNLRDLASRLDATDAGALNELDINECRRLAGALRAWTYIVEYRAKLATGQPLGRDAKGRWLKSGVLAQLQDGERAP